MSSSVTRKSGDPAQIIYPRGAIPPWIRAPSSVPLSPKFDTAAHVAGGPTAHPASATDRGPSPPLSVLTKYLAVFHCAVRVNYNIKYHKYVCITT